ncbi:MAG: type IV pilus assembly protein PilM [Solirubrobacterales bacterium]
MIQLTKRKDDALVGLEIEAGSIAAAEVRTNGSARLSATAIAPLPAEVFHDGEVADPEGLARELRDVFSRHRLSRRVRLGVANPWVVVRTLRLPAIDDPVELEAAVRFQAQEQIPMPIEQAVLDHRIVGGIPAAEGSPAQVDVVVVAARREMILALLQPLRKAGLQPVGVDLSAFGLIRALGVPTDQHEGAEGAPAQSSEATLFCHVSAVTNLAIARGTSCLFTRVSPVGLEAPAADLAASTGLPLEHARLWLAHVGLGRPLEQIDGDPQTAVHARAAIEEGASPLLDELRTSLDYYGAQEGAIPVGRVVLCGPGSAIPGLAEHMQSVIGLPFAVGRPHALAGYDDASAARLTLSYGLALES